MKSELERLYWQAWAYEDWKKCREQNPTLTMALIDYYTQKLRNFYEEKRDNTLSRMPAAAQRLEAAKNNGSNVVSITRNLR